MNLMVLIEMGECVECVNTTESNVAGNDRGNAINHQQNITRFHLQSYQRGMHTFSNLVVLGRASCGIPLTHSTNHRTTILVDEYGDTVAFYLYWLELPAHALYETWILVMKLDPLEFWTHAGPAHVHSCPFVLQLKVVYHLQLRIDIDKFIATLGANIARFSDIDLKLGASVLTENFEGVDGARSVDG